MKSLFTLFISLFFVGSLFAQTRTSVANGNWTMPTTWDCMCVPTPGSDVVINHTVTLTSNWGYTSGSITINAGGSLIQDATPRAFGQSGGSFNNAGTVTLSKMGFQGGTLSNSGTINSNDSLYLAVNLNNTGTIQSNNLYSSAQLTNSGGISGINFFNNGTFINSTTITFINHYNNATSYNNGILNFTDYTNAGKFYNNVNGLLTIYADCTNGDTINHDAHWYNNGSTLISNDFTNKDTLDAVASTNRFCVQHNSTNLGKVIGVLDFCCMLTNTFGINTGIIGPNVVYCQNSGSCFGTIKETNSIFNIEIFPNPIKQSFTINTNSNLIESIEIIDVLGKVIYSQEVNSTDEILIYRNEIPSGLYILKATATEGSFTSKVLFE